jgi:FkbM family methyltransferase
LFSDDIQSYHNGLQINPPSKFNAIKQRIPSESPTIVDAGAAINAGDNWIDNFLQIFETPTIHAIEPRPAAVESLRARYSDNDRVIVHDCAIGAESNKIQINVAAESGSSSVYTPKDVEQRREIYKKIENQIEVRQVPLDELIDDSIDIIKLDIEGYELEALKGAPESLSTADIVVTELQFNPYYEGAVSADKLIRFLRQKNFELHNIYDYSVWENGKLEHGDGLFMNSEAS